MNNLTLSLNGISESPPVRAVQRWVQRHGSKCALGILAGMTIAGLVVYRYSTQKTAQATCATYSPPSNPVFPPSTPASTSSVVSGDVAPTQSSMLDSQDRPEDSVVHRLCTDPYQFYKEIKFSAAASKIDSLKLFRLCVCPNLNNVSREKLENHAMGLLSQSCATSLPLTIVSVGPGGCYQELVYLAKLANAGYKQINLVLIEPENLSSHLATLSVFCKQNFPACTVNIIKFDDLEQYKNFFTSSGLAKPNLLLLLDIDENFVNGKNLPDYSFELLQSNGMLEPKTVISYSIRPVEPNVNGVFFPKFFSCSYESSSSLNNIQSNRIEGLVHPNGFIPIFTSPTRWYPQICGGSNKE
jgi:hypothetical protein